MSKSIHQQAVEKLNELETELLHLISETSNEELMDKFLEWQDQRAKCNDALLFELEELL